MPPTQRGDGGGGYDVRGRLGRALGSLARWRQHPDAWCLQAGDVATEDSTLDPIKQHCSRAHEVKQLCARDYRFLQVGRNKTIRRERNIEPGFRTTVLVRKSIGSPSAFSTHRPHLAIQKERENERLLLITSYIEADRGGM